MILAHGYPETLQLFARLLPALAERFTVYAFDWPGQGYSARQAGPTDPIARADLLARLMDALALPRAHILATDMGVHPALALASTRPERVHGVVAMNALLFGDGPTSWEIAIMRRAGLNQLAFTQAPSVVYAQCKRTFLPRGASFPAALDDDFLTAMRDPRVGAFLSDLCDQTEAALPQMPSLYWKIQTPLLLLWAERDAHFPLAQAERLEALLPQASLTVLHDAHHWMAYSRAAEVAAHATRFWETL